MLTSTDWWMPLHPEFIGPPTRYQHKLEEWALDEAEYIQREIDREVIQSIQLSVL